MSARETYAQLVARGCMCGSDRPQDCPMHKAGDNRGIRAYFEAGMPQGFPTTANCMLCGGDSLMYPSIPLDAGRVQAGEAPPPTLVCPTCSHPANEAALVREAEQFGYALNARRVFALAVAA